MSILTKAWKTICSFLKNKTTWNLNVFIDNSNYQNGNNTYNRSKGSGVRYWGYSILLIIVCLIIAFAIYKIRLFHLDINSKESILINTPTTEDINEGITSNHYESKEFLYKIDIPKIFTESSLDEADSDKFFYTSDGEAKIVICARHIYTGAVPKEFSYDYFLKSYGGSEIYGENNMDEDGWFARSIISPDNVVLYRKCIKTSDTTICMYTLSYPFNTQHKYNSDKYNYVDFIENSFRRLK